ncbi:DUF1573 domain-containing protein [Rapidithrix thailandica]|uniref:DUF1573 domain-containing protein n=1 Tax=Rapidithrix thailandica TaxID=413964 RepID=A0AAW9RXJ2_9BACT
MKLLNHLSIFVFIIGTWACSPTHEAKQDTQMNVSTANTSSSIPMTVIKEPEAPKAYAAFDFEKTFYDFGTIQQGDIVKHTFKFVNSGEVPLVISDIKTTCGCTAPKYSKNPVAPGESGEILVQFNSAGKRNLNKKPITIYANVEGGTYVINIQANVKVEEELKGPYKKQ